MQLEIDFMVFPFHRMCVHGDLSIEYMAKLAMNLWTLAKGTKQCDRELMVSKIFRRSVYFPYI